jgi:hypothetical protein
MCGHFANKAAILYSYHGLQIVLALYALLIFGCQCLPGLII